MSDKKTSVRCQQLSELLHGTNKETTPTSATGNIQQTNLILYQQPPYTTDASESSFICVAPLQFRNGETIHISLANGRGCITTVAPLYQDLREEHCMNEVRHFARQFKMKRLSMGLSQTQVGQALSYKHGHVYSSSVICRFEKLDLSQKAMCKLRPILEDWMNDGGKGSTTSMPGIQPSNAPNPSFPIRCRKQRPAFSTRTLAMLNKYFAYTKQPLAGEEMMRIAELLEHNDPRPPPPDDSSMVT